MKPDWQKLLRAAYVVGSKSKNPSTQNGAVLVDDSGKILIEASNTLTPDRVKETEERTKVQALRHKFSVHAERNSIFKAAKEGIKTNGLTMVCAWAACSECSQAIIQAGIKRLVTHKQALDKNGDWATEVELGFTMLREAGIDIIIYDGEIGGAKILRSGKHWEP